MLYALIGFRRNFAQPRLDPGYIQFGRSQQGAQLIVQFPGQVAAFVLPHLLQVRRQFGQRCGTFTHFLVQIVALLLQGKLLSLARSKQGSGLPQVQVKRHQARQGDQPDAKTRDLKRSANMGLGSPHLAIAGIDQFGDLAADHIHLLHADIGRQDEFPGILIALFAHAHTQIHLCQFARHVDRQSTEFSKLGRVGRIVPAQGFKRLIDVGGCSVVRIQVLRVAGQQVASLPGLRVQHVLQQFGHRSARGMGFFKTCGGLGGQLKTGFVGGNQNDRRQHRQRQADCHFGYYKPSHPHLRSVFGQ